MMQGEENLVDETEKKLKISSWNLSASEYVPNANATEYVPSFAVSSPGTSQVRKSPTSSENLNEAAPIQDHLDNEFFTEKEAGKENLNIVFIGHVDAGKSTLGGHILYLTGSVDKRTIEKFEREAKEISRESWYLSWALDTNQEERDKGKTVFCGKGSFQTEKRHITVIDAPGHKTYVPNMIGGASQADIGVLVVSARKGEFESGFERGQTKEHVKIAKTLGISKIIAVINKMDDPTVQWSKERYDMICENILKYLKQCGYNTKTEVNIMPISGFTGANIKDRLNPSVCNFYEGPSLLELLDTIDIPERKESAALMIPIVERVKDMGIGISGKVESGKVTKGQSVVIMPNKTQAEVLSIMIDDDEVKSAKAGDNVFLKLKNVDENDCMPGFLISEVGSLVKSSNHFIAQLQILEVRNIISAGFSSVLHVHSCTEEVVIAELLHLIDKKTNKRLAKKPTFIKQGQRVNVRIECAGTICIETFKDFPQLGRFTLRNEGDTIALGKVIKVLSPHQNSMLSSNTAAK